MKINVGVVQSFRMGMGWYMAFAGSKCTLKYPLVCFTAWGSQTFWLSYSEWTRTGEFGWTRNTVCPLEEKTHWSEYTCKHLTCITRPSCFCAYSNFSFHLLVIFRSWNSIQLKLSNSIKMQCLVHQTLGKKPSHSTSLISSDQTLPPSVVWKGWSCKR